MYPTTHCSYKQDVPIASFTRPQQGVRPGNRPSQGLNKECGLGIEARMCQICPTLVGGGVLTTYLRTCIYIKMIILDLGSLPAIKEATFLCVN